MVPALPCNSDKLLPKTLTRGMTVYDRAIPGCCLAVITGPFILQEICHHPDSQWIECNVSYPTTPEPPLQWFMVPGF